jgi:hypothetical protein
LQPATRTSVSSAPRSSLAVVAIAITIGKNANTPARRLHFLACWNSIARPGIGVYEGTVPPAGNCASCGAAVTSATSYLTEHGLLCWACFTRVQNSQEAAARSAADLDQSLDRRAASLGYLHGVMWASTIILATRPAHLPEWLSGILILGAFVLAWGLRMRASWAYRVAVSIDLGGVAALLAVGLARFEVGRILFFLFLALFPAMLFVLARVLRRAFVADAAARPEEVR